MKTDRTAARTGRYSTSPAPRPTPRVIRTGRGEAGDAWQLEMFRYSLKKQQKLSLLLELLGPLDHEPCLLITHGDNPGSLNYHLREAGGVWSWAELEADCIPQMEALLGEPVSLATPTSLPFESGAFERVVVVDVHGHLDELTPLNREIMRVLRPQGVAIVTTPNGDPRLPLAAVKRWVGMSNENYGHRVQGYTTAQLTEMMTAMELQPLAHGAYSRFFTEFAELAINFGHVRMNGRKPSAPRPPGEVESRSAAGLASASRSYRIFRAVFPLIRAFSRLDALIPGRSGYAVAVVVQKP